jgi:hypothetical protein
MRRGVVLVNVICLLAALALLFGFTLLHTRQDYALGAAVFYANALLLFATRLPVDVVLGLGGNRRFAAFFLSTNVIILTIGFGIAADIESAKAITRFAYSAFYDELYVQMVEWYNKPVTVFSTHSIAAFASFVFFVGNVLLFGCGRRVFALLALAHLLILVLLKSVSAIGFLVLSILVLLIATRGVTRIATVVVLGVGLPLAFWQISDYLPILWRVVTATESGFLGRYAEGTALERTIDYILNYPLLPIGLTFDPGLFYGDSGFVEYVLRGSLPLLILMYAALWLFLARYVDSPRVRAGLFSCILLFETGYTMLTQPRAPGLLILLALTYVVSKQRVRNSDALPRSHHYASVRAAVATSEPVRLPHH